MAANSRVLLAYVNIWASDEEKSHLKHLRQTNMNEFSSYLLEVMPTLQMRQGTDWLEAYNCPVIIRKESKRPLVGLARAVLRIRTTMHADCLDYDMDGLLRTLRARVMVGILEHRMRVYLKQLRLRLKFVIQETEVSTVASALRIWGVRGKCEEIHGQVLWMLVDSCRTGRQILAVDVATLETIPSLFVDTCVDTELQRFMSRMPRSLVHAPVHKQLCWHCGGFFARGMRKCGDCKRARYCSRECQVDDWGEHEKACENIAGFLNREWIDDVMFSEVSVHETWGSFLREHFIKRHSSTSSKFTMRSTT